MTASCQLTGQVWEILATAENWMVWILLVTLKWKPAVPTPLFILSLTCTVRNALPWIISFLVLWTWCKGIHRRSFLRVAFSFLRSCFFYFTRLRPIEKFPLIKLESRIVFFRMICPRFDWSALLYLGLSGFWWSIVFCASSLGFWSSHIHFWGIWFNF